METVLDFGKYKGSNLGDILEVDPEYVVWLAGWRVHGDTVSWCLESFVDTVWENRDCKHCICRTDSDLKNGKHSTHCYFYFLKNTRVETKVFIINHIEEGTSKSALGLKVWIIHILRRRSELVDLSRLLLKDKCLHCFGKLVPIGYDRVNGADHADWSNRYFHKKCWKKLQYY